MECPWVLERAYQALRACGVKAHPVPIRGGTDGARLSYEGLPCPNLCTGGENFHSRFEFVCCESMEKISDIIVKIIEKRMRAYIIVKDLLFGVFGRLIPVFLFLDNYFAELIALFGRIADYKLINVGVD